MVLLLLLTSLDYLSTLFLVAICWMLWRFTRKPNVTTTMTTTTPNFLSAERIPGPYRLPFVGSLYKYLPGGEYSFSLLLESHMKMYKKYGPIVHESLGGKYKFVRLFDPKDVKKVIRSEGRYPTRPTLECILKVAEDINSPTYLPTQEGENWFRQRAAVQKYIMNSKNVSLYLSLQEKVADDFVTYLRGNLNKEGEVDDLVEHLKKYSLEAVGLVCYNKRLGLLETETARNENVQDENSEDGNTMLRAVNRITDQMLPIIQRWHFVERGYLKAQYERFVEAFRTANRLSRKLIKEAMHSETGVVENTILHKFLQNEKISFDETVSIMDLAMIGGIDSTAYTLGHVIYHLTKHPEIQDFLYKELKAEVGVGQPVKPEVLKDGLKYLKAVVQETNRLTPAAGNSVFRTLQEDIVVSGYKIPKGWNVAVENAVMGRLPQYFENPEEFKPERWLKDKKDLQRNCYSVLPFGMGARSCPGRKIAMQEIYLCLIKLVLTCRIEYHHEEIGIKNYTFQQLDKPLRVKLIRR